MGSFLENLEKEGVVSRLKLVSLVVVLALVASVVLVCGSIVKAESSGEIKGEPAETLAGFAANLKYSDLPQDVVNFIKRDILDQLGILIAGSCTGGCKEVADLVKAQGGKEESTILVFGGKVPAASAAFAGSMAARALDLGSCHPEGCHFSEYAIAPMLAAAELKGRVTGEEFIAAYAAGKEVGDRIGDASHAISIGAARGLHPSICPQMGSTVAVSKLLGLNKQEIWNAMGIRFGTLSAIDMEMFVEGSDMLKGHMGFCGADTINAALLAKNHVFEGVKSIFSGPRGWFHTYYPNPDEVEPALLTRNLGKEWTLLRTKVKPYMGCQFIQTPVDATIALCEEKEIDSSKIAEIKCEIPKGHVSTVASSEMWTPPKTRSGALFSLPYCVATGAIKGTCFVKDFTPAEMSREDVIALMKKVKVIGKDMPSTAATVTITMEDGTKYTKHLEYNRGDPRNPWGTSIGDIIGRYWALCDSCDHGIPDWKLEEVLGLITHLEKVDDVTRIPRLLTPGS